MVKQMGCRVPDFVTEGDNPFVFPRKIPDLVGEDFVELEWQKGPFFQRRSPDLPHADPAIPCRTEPYAACGVASHTAAAAPLPSTELFMEEDEMASWLYYPVGGDDDPGGGGVNPTDQLREAADVAGPEQGFPAAAADLKVEADVWASPGRPPLHPETRGRSAVLAAPLPLPAWGETSTVVDSSATTEPGGRTRPGAVSRVSSGDVRGAPAACEHGPASSSGLTWEGEEEGEAAAKAAARGDKLKRKAREDDDRCDSHSEDADFEPGGKRRDVRRSASARRARAAEVHNLSERRRRDRINEKMKALQQLIPRCHKSDKASMLDDAIEYMKSLQMQVQMLSRCCNMAPMMFPGVQQYMQSMGMGIPVGMMNMGMGVGMAMASGGLSHPMMPFPTVMLGARMAAANGAPHLSQRLPLQPVHAPGAALADQTRLQGTSQAGAASSSACITTPSTVQLPDHLAGVRHQVRPQSRAITEPGSSKGTSTTEKSKLG